MPTQASSSMTSPQPTMIRKAKNGISTGGRSCGGKSVSPTSFEVEAHAADQAAENREC